MKNDLIERGEIMKRAYHKPSVKKIDYDFTEQVMASSIPEQKKLDPWLTNEHCTWGTNDCSVIFNVATRGLDNCLHPGT